MFGSTLSPRPIDKTLAKYTLVALLPLALVLWLSAPWPLLRMTLMLAYVVALASCLYRLTPWFIARNPPRRFILREQRHLKVCSLAGFFDLHGPWHSVPIETISSVYVWEHGIELSAEDGVFRLSVVGSRESLHAHMRSVLADALAADKVKLEYGECAKAISE
ncbi:hypothetical protein [Pseudoalteromonas sp. T1lg75]|uniref:hypothetical protein n=1 Tax=Pseudoalteromonas sp. T1lg75 TaxID=2077102 RepID=UPI000CF6AD89|nr:hypothetical protein [Pseudoalteromonas sp. T1lg75]